MTSTRRLRTPGLALTLAAALALASLAGDARAAESVLVLDPEETRIDFLVQATGHDVHGAFALDEGEIHFDPATGTASGRIAVDAVHAATGSGSRDKTMHRKVLESARFPIFVFEARRFEGELPATGEGDVSLVGTLRIHGGDHRFTLPAHVRREGDRVEATSTFEIPYVEWGMHNPSLLFLRVADRVEVTVTAHGTLAPGTTAVAARP